LIAYKSSYSSQKIASLRTFSGAIASNKWTHWYYLF